MVTSLPVLFENRVVDVLLTLREIVIEHQEDTLPQINEELRDNAKEHFAVLLDVSGLGGGRSLVSSSFPVQHFLGSLDCLAFHVEEEANQEPGESKDLLPVTTYTTCKVSIIHCYNWGKTPTTPPTSCYQHHLLWVWHGHGSTPMF